MDVALVHMFLNLGWATGEDRACFASAMCNVIRPVQIEICQTCLPRNGEAKCPLSVSQQERNRFFVLQRFTLRLYARPLGQIGAF